MAAKSFFSVSYDLITRDTKVPYDLYVNSSALKNKQKFIRIFPMNEELTETDLAGLKQKYLQLYVSEDQRSYYMRSLVDSEAVGDIDALDFIKDSAIEYLQKVFEPGKEFTTEILSETIEGCRDAVENMIDVLGDYDIDGLRALIGGLSGHDFYTFDHSINVSMYCMTVLRVIKPTASRVELLHAGLGGLLHDLGKMEIPTEILNNPSGLSEDEYQVIKTHPDLGLKLLLDNDDLKIENIDLETIARVVHEHHEDWIGGGYPRGIKEKEIHLLARVCAIADFFDAITTKRSYNNVLTVSQGLDVMAKTAGKKLDPKIFKAFQNHVSTSNVQSTKQLKLADSFDPTLPYENLPLEEVEEMFTDADFGKIRVIEEKEK